jgi:lysozyme
MPTSTSVTGIDVSHYQGVVDWTAVKAANIGFAFAKASEGEAIVDAQFDANWQGMKAAGLLRGAYHFYDSTIDPVAQAKNFLNAVGSLAAADLPPVLDIEIFRGPFGNSSLANNVLTWLNTVQQGLGRTPMIYTGPSFWNQYMNDQFGAYPLWVAEYGVAAPRIPPGWNKWTFWQSTQAASVAGVKGSVDGDTFAGSANDLLAFIQGNVANAGNPGNAGNIATSPTSVNGNGNGGAVNGTSYTVQSGDTLSDIARQFNVSVNQLVAANSLSNPNLIAVGQVLNIPS